MHKNNFLVFKLYKKTLIPSLKLLEFKKTEIKPLTNNDKHKFKPKNV